MENLIIESTKTTPKIEFNNVTGQLSISGRSLPENVLEFYGPAMNWLTSYFANPNPKTEIVFEMEYFNTASSKEIFEIIKLFDSQYKKGIFVNVIWRYAEEDEDTMEVGQDYSSLVEIPLVLHSYAG